MTLWRWGMIGCGDVTERKSGPAYARAENSRLAAVAARKPERARAYAARHGVPEVFDTIDALIASPHIDAIYIATPPDAHLELALKVARAGKPCCVEKPIANSHADAMAMVEAFREAGQPLFVAYYRRTLPRFEQVRAWLDGGAIGAVRHVQWSFSRPPLEADLTGQAGWRVEAEHAPGGYFDDLAVHGFDLFDHLVGPVRRAVGFTAHPHHLYSAPSAVSACWQHENGATGSGYWNFAAGVDRDSVSLIGSDGEIRFAIFDEAPIELLTADRTERLHIRHPDPVQLPHVTAMIEHLDGISIHPSTGDSAARTAWVSEEILRAAAD